MVEELMASVAAVLASVDDTGCSEGLTVVDAEAIEALREAFAQSLGTTF